VNLSQRHSGKWDDNKYVINTVNQSYPYHPISIQDSNVEVDGLQLFFGNDTYTVPHGIRISPDIAGDIIIKNSIIKNDLIKKYASSGIYIESNLDNLNSVIFNNIIYGDMKYGIYDSGYKVGGISGLTKVFNNTIYDVKTYGLYSRSSSGRTILANNNLVLTSDMDYYGIYDSSSSNNISSDSTAPGTNSITNATVQFFDATNNDFRLSSTDTVARDAGIDLSSDDNYAFNSDIMGNARGNGLAWDIGAHEGAAIIRRSVGLDSRNLNFNSRIVTIATTTATFSGPVADNIGVGDVVQYGSPLQLAFIESRTSSTTFEVRDKSGNYPTATTTATASIYRAHLYLDDWEDQVVGDVNQSIDASLQTDVLVNQDLTASNTVMYVSAYASTSVDTLNVAVNDWTTRETNYIKIYAPNQESEVGTSQRHSGIWDDTKYRLLYTTSGDSQSAISIYDDYTKLEGLQIGIYSNSHIYARALKNYSSPLIIDKTILRDMDSGSYSAIYSQGSAFNATITNSVIYGGFEFGVYLDSGASAILYNNTITETNTGFRAENGSEILKNNVFFNNTDDFSGVFTTLDYNASDDGDGIHAIDISPGTVEADGWHSAFVDYLNNDFRVRDMSSVLYDSGVIISTITDDIAGNPRPYHDGYDVGAFEYSKLKPKYRLSPGGSMKLKGFLKFW